MEVNSIACKSECQLTSSLIDGHRMMIAQTAGKFKAGEPHPQCEDCLKNLLAEGEKQIPIKQRLNQIKKFFNNKTRR